MDFGQLLAKAKAGAKVTRPAWGGSFVTYAEAGDTHLASSQVAGELGIKAGAPLVGAPYLAKIDELGNATVFIPNADDLLATDYALRS